ncbi:MAG TPA: DUF2760 domain-containing protein [Bryobacteraceae bacterium]|nr:DUF2760 domain-containing protein [Bryobacteraceae bacterium]
MNRVFLAFRSFFGLLIHGRLSDQVITTLGLSTAAPAQAVAKQAPAAPTSDGALQLLAILQRDSRLVDFLMEDVSAYSDDQIGAAVRELHGQARQSLLRYVHLTPVIDGVENTRTSVPGGKADPGAVKFVGNVPAQPPTAGLLRHKGWRADKIELPPAPKEGVSVIAPAEIEVE